MSLHPDIIDAMIAAGASAEVVAAACRAAHAVSLNETHAKRKGAADRQRRKRERDLVDEMEAADESRESRVTSVTSWPWHS